LTRSRNLLHTDITLSFLKSVKNHSTPSELGEAGLVSEWTVCFKSSSIIEKLRSVVAKEEARGSQIDRSRYFLSSVVRIHVRIDRELKNEIIRTKE
jgi:hypothetical protein